MLGSFPGNLQQAESQSGQKGRYAVGLSECLKRRTDITRRGWLLSFNRAKLQLSVISYKTLHYETPTGPRLSEHSGNDIVQ